MLFNSIPFAIFFIFTYLLYLIINRRDQNRLLLGASYIFYGAWDWRFLLLLMFSTGLDFILARAISRSTNSGTKKALLTVSIGASLGILGFFKYFNFFADSLVALLQIIGLHASFPLLHVILPVGISFYTFQTMSYTIDVYRGQAKPFDRLLDFALYVSFFPQLVAGPIERSENLRPQILADRQITFAKIRSGGWLIFWGLFKKVAIADNMATIAGAIFDSSSPASGWAVWAGVYAFALQIYCDFSGYSDMARGLARVMGFELMVNFDKPYVSTNPSEFWQRWHISLSQWLRDYLYIPMGGNRAGTFQTCKNLMLTMLLGGLWHGAAWTFVFWGGFHSLLLILYHAFKEKLAWASRVPVWLRSLFFFHLICVGWVFFRAQSLPKALELLRQMFTDFRPGELLSLLAYSWQTALMALVVTCATILYIRAAKAGHSILNPAGLPALPRFAFYTALLVIYLLIAPTRANQFIYFQF